MVDGKKFQDVNDFNKYQELIQAKVDALIKANNAQGELINNIEQRYQLIDKVENIRKEYEKACDDLATFETQINSLPEETAEEVES